MASCIPISTTGATTRIPGNRVQFFSSIYSRRGATPSNRRFREAAGVAKAYGPISFAQKLHLRGVVMYIIVAIRRTGRVGITRIFTDENTDAMFSHDCIA